MAEKAGNHYEKAFVNWLIDSRIRFTATDQSKRAVFGETKLKRFDYFLYPNGKPTIIAELKGRAFKGNSFEKLTGCECWTFADDVEGLSQWQKIFGDDHRAYFIFAYCIEKVDVDFDGREAFELGHRKYLFFAVSLNDYRENMKLRSPKWRTVTLSADNFRKCAIPLEELLKM